MCATREILFIFLIILYKKFVFLSIAVIKKFFYSSGIDLQCVPISALERNDTVIHK